MPTMSMRSNAPIYRRFAISWVFVSVNVLPGGLPHR
jgi:hypothetical protein